MIDLRVILDWFREYPSYTWPGRAAGIQATSYFDTILHSWYGYSIGMQ